MSAIDWAAAAAIAGFLEFCLWSVRVMLRPSRPDFAYRRLQVQKIKDFTLSRERRKARLTPFQLRN